MHSPRFGHRGSTLGGQPPRLWLLLVLTLAPARAVAQVPSKIVPERPKATLDLDRARLARLARPIVAGESVRGELSLRDPVLAADQSPYEVWSYRGKAGEVLSVLMRSIRVDAYVLVLRANAGALEMVGEDDDGLGAGTSDAGLRIRLPADGEYFILANASSSLGRAYFYGPYQLEVVSSLPQATPRWSELYPGGGNPRDGYAVVVGISDYPGEDEDLTGPRQDAELFRQMLIFQWGFKPENVLTLTDRNGTRDQIINGFRRFLSQAGPEGRAVFYFSGNGTEVEEAAPESGAERRSAGTEALYVWSHDASEKGSVVLSDELSALAGDLRAGRVLLVLDASFSGIGSRGESPRGAPKLARIRDLRGWLAPPSTYLDTRGVAADPPGNQVWLLASGNKEVAWTATGWPERGGIASVFTYFLVDAMKNSTTGTTLQALMAGVRDRTDDFSRTSFGRTQTPQAAGSHLGDLLPAFLGP